MDSKRNSHGVNLTIMFALIAAIFFCATVVNSYATADQVKQIERKLSQVKRQIPTSPSRAEKEWLAASEMLSQLESSDPSNAKLSTLQKKIVQLGKKLEKRLNRPIGGSSPEVKKATVVQPPKSGATDLPGSVTSRFAKINSSLDAVEKSLTKNQLQSAVTKLKTAQKTMAEIEQRYSKKIPAGNMEMKAVTARLATVTGQVNLAQSSASKMAEAETANKMQKETQSQQWIAEFAQFSDAKSDSYLLVGSNFNSASKEQQEKCSQAYSRANALMAEYQKTDFPFGKTQQLLFMEPGLIDKLRYYNEGQSKSAQRQASKEWVEKLRNFVASGAGRDKYLIASVTASEAQIKEQEALFSEAQAIWSEYQKAEFALGKTPQLLELENDMRERLAQMPEALRKSKSLLAGDLDGELDRILAHLNRDTGWKNDTSKTPNIAMQRDIEPLHEALARYGGTVDANDPKLAALKEKIAQIEKTDQQNRAIRAQRTFMEPERYTGGDASELRQKVSEIVKEKSPAVLRVTLRAADWKEEEVLEWTDTTKSATRYRITKAMTAHAAAKGDDGKVYLQSVHLASDRKSDGSWGPLYGHIKWSDWMAEENVSK